MTQEMTCSNAECQTVFTVEDKEVGDVVNCPKCDIQCTVLADFGADFDISTITPPEPGKSLHHPARQICTNCGAVLGVRAAICPYCRADIRTGAAIMHPVEEKKRNLRPVLIYAGVAGLVILGIVVLLVVLT